MSNSGGHEALDRVVLTGKAVLVDQILVDGRGVAFEVQLGLDERPVGFAQVKLLKHKLRQRPSWRDHLSWNVPTYLQQPV